MLQGAKQERFRVYGLGFRALRVLWGGLWGGGGLGSTSGYRVLWVRLRMLLNSAGPPEGRFNFDRNSCEGLDRLKLSLVDVLRDFSTPGVVMELSDNKRAAVIT